MPCLSAAGMKSAQVIISPNGNRKNCKLNIYRMFGGFGEIGTATRSGYVGTLSVNDLWPLSFFFREELDSDDGVSRPCMLVVQMINPFWSHLSRSHMQEVHWSPKSLQERSLWSFREGSRFRWFIPEDIGRFQVQWQKAQANNHPW